MAGLRRTWVNPSLSMSMEQVQDRISFCAHWHRSSCCSHVARDASSDLRDREDEQANRFKVSGFTSWYRGSFQSPRTKLEHISGRGVARLDPLLIDRIRQNRLLTTILMLSSCCMSSICSTRVQFHSGERCLSTVSLVCQSSGIWEGTDQDVSGEDRCWRCLFS